MPAVRGEGVDSERQWPRRPTGGEIVIRSANSSPSDARFYASCGADGVIAKGQSAFDMSRQLACVLFGLAGMELLRMLSSKGLSSVMDDEKARYHKIEIVPGVKHADEAEPDKVAGQGQGALHPPLASEQGRGAAPQGESSFYSTYGS